MRRLILEVAVATHIAPQHLEQLTAEELDTLVEILQAR